MRKEIPVSDTAKLLAAADLADRYIETILSTQPDLLVGDIVDCDSSEVGALAERLAHYREALINELQGQPLPYDYYEDDEEESED